MEKWTTQLLQQFEERIANQFNEGKIQAPVHLSDGNESQLIEIFKSIRSEDFVFCSSV